MVKVHLKSGKVIEFPSAAMCHTIKSMVPGFGDTFIVGHPTKGVLGQFPPDAVEWAEVCVEGEPPAREVPETNPSCLTPGQKGFLASIKRDEAKPWDGPQSL